MYPIELFTLVQNRHPNAKCSDDVFHGERILFITEIINKIFGLIENDSRTFELIFLKVICKI
jgi:hypothetical protein